jgi:PhoH-like ATPase
MNDLYDTEVIKHKAVDNLPVNTGLVISSERGSALGRVEKGGKVRLVRGDRDVFGVHGRSAEQRLAIDLLLDSDVGIVSLGGRAGTGKSAMALLAGLETVLERRQHK